MLTIPSHYLKAALTHAGDRDVRDYLNCVRVEVVSTGDIYIVATDGARLFAGRIPAPDEAQLPPLAVSIPRDAVKRALTSRTPQLVLQLDPLMLGDISFKQPDGTYPDWRRIVPARVADEAPIDCNWHLMSDAEAALRTWTSKKFMPVHASFRGTSSVLVTCEDENAFAVVMPLRRGPKSVPFAERFEPVR